MLIKFLSFLCISLSLYSQSLTLNDASYIALKNNLQLKIDIYEQQLLQQDMIKEDAPFDTNLLSSYTTSSFNSALLTTYNTKTLLVGLEQKTLWGNTLGINYSQITNDYTPKLSSSSTTSPYNTLVNLTFSQNLLKNFGKKINTTKKFVIQKTVENSKKNYFKNILDTLYNTQIAYWNHYEATHIFQLEQQGFQLVETLLKQKERMVELGSFPRSLLQEIYSSRADSLTLIADSERTTQTTKLSLQNHLGSFNEIETHDVPSLLIPDFGHALSTALEQRSELYLLRNDIEALKRLVIYYDNQQLPSLSLNAQVTLNNPNANGSTLTPLASSHNTTTAGVSLSIPLENTQAKADLTKTRLSLLQKEASLEKNIFDITTQVQRCIIELKRLKHIIHLAKESFSAQEHVLIQEDKKFELGLTTIKNYLDNQRLLISRHKTLIKYQTDYMRTLAEYYKILGILPPYLHFSLGEHS